MERIINSALDNDFYSDTVGQVIFHQFADVNAEHTFITRTPSELPDKFEDRLREQVEMMGGIRMTDKEVKGLREQGVFKEDYLEYRYDYRFNPDQVYIKRVDGGIEAGAKGPLRETNYWETPFMATYVDLRNKMLGHKPDAESEKRAIEKAQAFEKAGVRYIEFGTRRRFSREFHERVLQILIENSPTSLLGTSNTELALKYGIPPKGTMNHMLFMTMAGLFGVENANVEALNAWEKEYEGNLNVALTDTFTTGYFMKNISKDMALRFPIWRQDSGDPKEYVDMRVNYLRGLDIDPRTQGILFSDGLKTQPVLFLHEYCKGVIADFYGIGTFITNDCGWPADNIVWKLYAIERAGKRVEVCKISDIKEKASGSLAAIKDAIAKIGSLD